MSKVLEKTADYSNQAVCKMVKPISCPRYMNDVYSIGTDLQYYIGDIYLWLSEVSRGDLKNHYRQIALDQLEIKKRIEEINNARLNELLVHFYNSGGTVIDPPLSYQQSEEMQPFFYRILNTFTKKLESSLVSAANGSINPDELESLVNSDIIEMYSNMSKLIAVDELAKAFWDLIAIRERV